MSVSPPRPKGPPLNALRAFEAAARLKSFSRAADELCVTPGAIAQQIKGLEVWLGVELFTRQVRGIKLTKLGDEVSNDFTHAFDNLGLAVQKMRAGVRGRVIHIATLPSIAQLWLSPRLPLIRKEFPEVTISVTAMETMPNLLRDTFDFGIFFSDRGQTETLFHIEKDELFPVCAPEFSTRFNRVNQLEAQELISDSMWDDDWSIWLEKPDYVHNGPSYSLYSLAVQEVINGAGVMIGHAPLVRPFIADGVLVEPFQNRISNGSYLSLVLPTALSNTGTLRRICEKLIGVGKTSAQNPG